jgi:hypothetical protein
MPPYAAHARPANAESMRVRTSAKATRLAMPRATTHDAEPRLTHAQKARQPAISSIAASTKRATLVVTLLH